MKIRKIGITLAAVTGSLLMATSIYAESYASVNVATLDVRQSPLSAAAIMKQYSKDETLKIVDQVSPEWYAVESSEGETAYVSAQYVDIFKVKATVNTNGVNVRTYPSESSKISRQFNKGQRISVHYQVGEWYYISLGTEPFFGFVHQSYIDDPYLHLVAQKDISQIEEVQIKEIPKSDPKVAKANKVIDYAKRFVGNPYRYGGNSLTNGIDCSGFTQQVMKKSGISLQRSSAAQYASNGVKVSTNNLKPGDLLFYGYNGRVSHVAIYIGNKQVVHANDPKTGITIGKAFPTRGKPLIGAKRVV